jgi:hypothetical protein
MKKLVITWAILEALFVAAAVGIYIYRKWPEPVIDLQKILPDKQAWKP